MSEDLSQQKKMLKILTNNTKDAIMITEEDEEKTISDLILELAEEKRSAGQGSDAQQLLGLLKDSNMFYKNRMIRPQVKIGDLNFKSEVEGNDNINFVDIVFQKEHTGGKIRFQK
jgi:hypothetical protein